MIMAGRIFRVAKGCSNEIIFAFNKSAVGTVSTDPARNRHSPVPAAHNSDTLGRDNSFTSKTFDIYPNTPELLG